MLPWRAEGRREELITQLSTEMQDLRFNLALLYCRTFQVGEKHALSSLQRSAEFSSEGSLQKKLVLKYRTIYFIVFCVGGSKELAALHESYSTATFAMQHSFVDENTRS